MGTHPIFESDFDCLTVESVSDSPNGKREKERMLLPKMRGAAWARNLLRKAGKVRGRVVRLQANLTRAGGIRTAGKRTDRFCLSNVRFFVQVTRRRATTSILQKMRKRVLQAASTCSK